MTNSRRGSTERDAELVVSLVASGLVRTRGWRGVRERERPYDRALQLGLDRLAAVCALAGVPGPLGVRDLVWDWSTSRPLDKWPLTFDPDAQVGGELLLIGGEPSEFCLEWSVEALDVVSEVHESTLVNQVKIGADQAGRPDLYAEWRRFVTTHSVLDSRAFLAAKNLFLTPSQWATWVDESYEPVPPTATRQGQIAVCGLCEQWMVPSYGGGWLCGSPRCLRTVHLPNPVLRDAVGAYRLRAELVRFVALPGRPELALAKELAARGARVVLYPQLDALDLVATWPDGHAIGVDVKDWHKPYLLARKVKQFPTWGTGHRFAYQEGFLVVPADRVARNRAYCDIVRRHSPTLRDQPHVQLLTDTALIARCPDTGRPGEVTCGA